MVEGLLPYKHSHLEAVISYRGKLLAYRVAYCTLNLQPLKAAKSGTATQVDHGATKHLPATAAAAAAAALPVLTCIVCRQCYTSIHKAGMVDYMDRQQDAVSMELATWGTALHIPRCPLALL
jgi:hypothetical protein